VILCLCEWIKLIYQTGEVLKEFGLEEDDTKKQKRDRPFVVSLLLLLIHFRFLEAFHLLKKELTTRPQ
jgi:hypothetical protein